MPGAHKKSQVGQEKVIEQFGPDLAETFIRLGVAYIFHTPFFLSLIGTLTVNMIACSMQRVFPKVRLLKLPLPMIGGKEIQRLPFHVNLTFLVLEKKQTSFLYRNSGRSYLQ